MRRFKAVIFDLDDTLYPERQYVLSGFRAVARWGVERLGVPEAASYAYLSDAFAAGVRGDTFNRWLASVGASDDLVPELVRVYREHQPVLSPYPGALELLAELRTAVPLGLVSDGYLDVQRAKFAALNLAEHFSAVVFSDQWGRSAWKPSSRPFEAALAGLGVAGGDAIYVADNPMKDFKGARAAGISTLWSRHCEGEYACLSAPSVEYAADVTVDSFEELKDYLIQSVLNPPALRGNPR